jgi:hypothetical protein
MQGVSELDDQPEEQAANAAEAPLDELSDDALDAVVGGVSVEAALFRAAAFDAGRLL